MAALATVLPAIASAATAVGGAAATTSAAGSFLGMSAGTWGALSAGAGALGMATSGLAANSANAQQAEYQAKAAQQKARIDESQYRYQARRELARGEAAAAASGLDPSRGTPMDLMLESAANAELNARRIRYGGQVESSAYNLQARAYRGRNWGTVAQGIGQGGGIFTNWWKNRVT